MQKKQGLTQAHVSFPPRCWSFAICRCQFRFVPLVHSVGSITDFGAFKTYLFVILMRLQQTSLAAQLSTRLAGLCLLISTSDPRHHVHDEDNGIRYADAWHSEWTRDTRK